MPSAGQPLSEKRRAGKLAAEYGIRLPSEIGTDAEAVNVPFAAA